MKKLILSVLAISTLALTSCKKDQVDETELGTATINGNVWANLDYTNDVNAQGIYDPGYMPEGVSGMLVKVEVNTSNWDESPVGGYDYPKKVYTTTTDASGNYTLTIPATADGYTITIEFEELFTTQTNYATDGTTTLTQEVEVSRGNISEFIYAGAVINRKDQASVNTVNNTTYEYGAATITGNVYANWDDSNDSPNFYDLCNASSPVAGKKIYMTYSEAPYNNGYENVFEFTINTDGTYTLNVVTEIPNQDDVDVYFGMQDFIADQIIDNAAVTADSTASSIYSMGGIQAYYQGTIYPGQVRVVDLYFSVSNL